MASVYSGDGLVLLLLQARGVWGFWGLD